MTTSALSNAHLSIAVRHTGAELCSLRTVSGPEVLWQADPKFWGRHSPILFPIVGKLANDRYTFEGKTYELKQHGFARDLEFDLVEQTDDSLLYQLASSPATLSCYPFPFILRAGYQLAETALTVRHEVHNPGPRVLPFSIGAHPGFWLTWSDTGRVEDYYLEFEKPEVADARLRDHNDLLLSDAETRRVLNNERQLPLRFDTFKNGALIFSHLQSQKIALHSVNHSLRITVEFPGFPDLGIWAPVGAPFVCIEPWHGHSDPARPYGDITNKPGIVKLGPGESFSCAYRIVIDGQKPMVFQQD